MKAVIMAGGMGSRLHPLTCRRPKPLVPVCNRPVMAYMLDLLAEHGIDEVLITLNHMPEAISGYFGSEYLGMRLHYVVEKTPLGTAGSVAQLRKQLQSTFLVVSADALTDIDLGECLRFHRTAGATATIVLTRVENPLQFGLVLTDRRGQVRRFLEKPGWGEVFSDTVNTGIYLLEPDALAGVPEGRPYDFSRHLFPALLQMEAPLFATASAGYWCDIGEPQSYLKANLDLLARRTRFLPPGREVAPGIWAEAALLDLPLIHGPALIGEGCRLAPGTRLEEGVILGPATVTGPGAVLRRSVTWTGAQIGPEATVSEAVLCEEVFIGAGAGLFEGVAVGTHCRVGEGAKLCSGVRVWPGTNISASEQEEQSEGRESDWLVNLLRRSSLQDRLGFNLPPDGAVKVGSAYARVLELPGALVVGGDPGMKAALIKQALIAGALAAGRNVLDVGVTASPITEYVIRRRQAAGGIHVWVAGKQAQLAFFGPNGSPAGRAWQAHLEQSSQRRDWVGGPETFAAAPDAVEPSLIKPGQWEPFFQAESLFLEEAAAQLQVDLIQRANLSVAITGDNRPVMNRWLKRLHCKRCKHADDSGDLRAEVDWISGRWRIDGLELDRMLVLDLWLAHRRRKSGGDVVAIPVTAPLAAEELLRGSGHQSVRVRQADYRHSDPILGLGRLLEWMAEEGLNQQEIQSWLPRWHTAERTVACPWEAKGRVMRRLLEEHAGLPIDLTEGLRVSREDEMTLLLPDSMKPIFRVYAEAKEPERAEAMASEYSKRITHFLTL